MELSPIEILIAASYCVILIIPYSIAVAAVKLTHKKIVIRRIKTNALRELDIKSYVEHKLTEFTTKIQDIYVKKENK